MKEFVLSASFMTRPHHRHSSLMFFVFIQPPAGSGGPGQTCWLWWSSAHDSWKWCQCCPGFGCSLVKFYTTVGGKCTRCVLGPDIPGTFMITDVTGLGISRQLTAVCSRTVCLVDVSRQVGQLVIVVMFGDRIFVPTPLCSLWDTIPRRGLWASAAR